MKELVGYLCCLCVLGASNADDDKYDDYVSLDSGLLMCG